MSGLLVAGTTSDAGKTLVTAGLCRWLARRGVKVAPFKAQNMANNAAVTADGAEIGRAQALQAAAAGVEPEAAMNPILLKPSAERRTQVVVLGKAAGEATASSYPARKAQLAEVVHASLADLRARFDVIVAEGAGSPAEINLRAHDLANMGLARAADLPTILVGDIDRGGVFAAFVGTVGLLEPADQALVAGFVVNKFRGDPAVLAPGLEQLRALTGRPTYGVLPWVEGVWLDGEDSLALTGARGTSTPARRDALWVAVARLPRLSNYTDVDPLVLEPGVTVTFTDDPAVLARADLAVIPGSKATVSDLDWLRTTGLADALIDRAARQAPVLGICGGYQMLGEVIVDEVETRTGEVAGLGLLPARTTFRSDKLVRRRRGVANGFGDAAAAGYEIRHGRIDAPPAAAWLSSVDGEAEGCLQGAVVGTSWHGLLESDALRRAMLQWVARQRDLDWAPGDVCFADAREAQLDRLGDLVEAHLDTEALLTLLHDGAPRGLPVVPPAGTPRPTPTSGPSP